MTTDGVSPFLFAFFCVQLLGVSCLVAIRMTEQRQSCRLCQACFFCTLLLVFLATLAALAVGCEAWTLGGLTLGAMAIGGTIDCRPGPARPTY